MNNRTPKWQKLGRRVLLYVLNNMQSICFWLDLKKANKPTQNQPQQKTYTQHLPVPPTPPVSYFHIIVMEGAEAEEYCNMLRCYLYYSCKAALFFSFLFSVTFSFLYYYLFQFWFHYLPGYIPFNFWVFHRCKCERSIAIPCWIKVLF